MVVMSGNAISNTPIQLELIEDLLRIMPPEAAGYMLASAAGSGEHGDDLSSEISDATAAFPVRSKGLPSLGSKPVHDVCSHVFRRGVQWDAPWSSKHFEAVDGTGQGAEAALYGLAVQMVAVPQHVVSEDSVRSVVLPTVTLSGKCGSFLLMSDAAVVLMRYGIASDSRHTEVASTSSHGGALSVLKALEASRLTLVQAHGGADDAQGGVPGGGGWSGLEAAVDALEDATRGAEDTTMEPVTDSSASRG